DDRDVVQKALSLARQRGIPIQEQSSSRLDAMSDGRPNQGLVLTASPLTVPVITSLGPFSPDDSTYELHTSSTSASLTMSTANARFPLFLALDSLSDPQNLGSILRTAHFFNIDGIVMTTSESVSVGSVVSKTSAGALEVLCNPNVVDSSHAYPNRLWTLGNLTKFVSESKKNGWSIYGTALHSDQAAIDITRYLQTRQSDPSVPSLFNGPTLLVMGSEGKGLRQGVAKVCDDHIVIGGNEFIDDDEVGKGQVGESLNVGVATGILLHALLCS
ncbi:Alpha/beta knot methyltransferase, partial [Gaertneriomyces semiglobifer]